MADGGFANIQTFSDVLVPETPTDQGDDLALALCKRGDLGSLGRGPGGCLRPRQVTEHPGNHRGFQPDLTSPHLGDGLEQRLSSFLLQYQPHGTMPYSLPVGLGVAHSCQDQDVCFPCSLQKGGSDGGSYVPTLGNLDVAHRRRGARG